MTIVITAKTRMGRDVCVGALDLETDRSLRLQRSDGSNQPADCSYEVGQTWEMEYQACANLRPPHLEDVMVLSERLVGRLENARELFLERVRIWRSRPQLLFDGYVRWTTNGAGYICERIGIPGASTGWWIPDRQLVKQRRGSTIPYHYQDMNGLHLTYVGLAEPTDLVPADTLVRVSLARWWRPEGAAAMEERCYLQLSGWLL
jgi:hypothetical protein